MGSEFSCGLLAAAVGSRSGKLHLEGALENPQDLTLMWRVLQMICTDDDTRARVADELGTEMRL